MLEKRMSNKVGVSSTIALEKRKRCRAALQRAIPLSVGLFAAGCLVRSAKAGSVVNYTAGSTYSQDFHGLRNTGATDVNTANAPVINGVNYFLPAAANTPFDFNASTGTAASNNSNGL